jgi:isoleucyl-tRNA synthetase
MQEVDRYALARYAAAGRTMLEAYEAYDFPAIFQAVNQFVIVDLSAFYADVSKDRLYTFGAGSPERRSAQTAMYVIADGLTRLLAPILPMTTDELWRHLPGQRDPSVHLAEFPGDFDTMDNASLVERWQKLVAIRDTVNAALELKRQDKTIGTSLGAHVRLRAGGDTAALLEQYRQDLPMLLIVSSVDLDPSGDPSGPVDVHVTRAEGTKCPRCWRVVTAVSSNDETAGLCDRCADALEAAGGSLAG